MAISQAQKSPTCFFKMDLLKEVILSTVKDTE